jgi:hypothetical protein
MILGQGVDKTYNSVKISPTNLVILGFWLSLNDSKVREKTRLGKKLNNYGRRFA